MTRNTPEPLTEAKRQRAAERRRLEEADTAKRTEDERQEIQRMSNERNLFERYKELSSYVDGIYDEVSKLSSKRPTDSMSERMVDRANRAINALKDLTVNEKDPFLDEIEEFVPAGDEVEARDVVLTLRQVKDALSRMRSQHEDWKFWH